MPASRRLERVAELLKREISEIIRRELTVEQVGLLTVNDVQLASDLRSATIYLGFVGSADQKKNVPARLDERSQRIRQSLGGALRLKFTPQVRFVFDDSVERGTRVLRILDEIEGTGTQSS